MKLQIATIAFLATMNFANTIIAAEVEATTIRLVRYENKDSEGKVTDWGMREELTKSPANQLVGSFSDYIDGKSVPHKYIGSFPIQPRSGEDGRLSEGTYTAYVFENGRGSIEILSAAGNVYDIDAKFVDKEDLAKFKTDLETNRDDPRRSNYMVNYRGDIVERKTDRVIIKADAQYGEDLATGRNVGYYPGGYGLPYNEAVQTDVSAEELMKLLAKMSTSDLKITVESKAGPAQIFNLKKNSPAPAQNNGGETLNFFKLTSEKK